MSGARKLGWRGLALGNRIAPARFLVFVLLLAACFLALRAFAGLDDWQDCLAMAFDIAAACFLLSLIPLLRDSKVEDIRRHAQQNNANRVLVLIITSLLTLVVMAGIRGELAPAQAGDATAVAKLIATLTLIWLFANTIYTLHYAHAFYGQGSGEGKDAGGLSFPETDSPDYVDFAYFAFTLGMTFQTSDVDITAPAIRRVALLHSFAAFVFNLGVIAFSINALGGGG
jgi:uncharacterized membrane protein